jgi:hypothetical protein
MKQVWGWDHRRGGNWRDERGDEGMGESRLGKGDEDRDDWKAVRGDEKEEGDGGKRGKRARV